MNDIGIREYNEVPTSDQFSLLILEELKNIRREIKEQFDVQTLKLEYIVSDTINKAIGNKLQMPKKDLDTFIISEQDKNNKILEDSWEKEEPANYSLVVAIDNLEADDQQFNSDLFELEKSTDSRNNVSDVSSIRGVLNQSEFTCQVCGKIFPNNCNLKVHMQIHLNKKQFKCEVCGVGFNAKGNLKKHVVLHSGLRPFQCDVCGKSFTRAYHLKSHKLVHVKNRRNRTGTTKENIESNFENNSKKPLNTNNHTCEVCSKNFKKKSSLNEHMLSHSNSRKFQCEICGQEFKTRNTCRKHLINHSGVRPYECNICKKSFTRASHLNAHKITAKHILKQKLVDGEVKNND